LNFGRFWKFWGFESARGTEGNAFKVSEKKR